MHQMEDESVLASLDPEIVLQGRQAVILNQIDVLTRDATIHNSPKSGYIYTLKQEYNQLVKKRAELARTSLSDPMEVLPPDLWPDIIRNIVQGPQYPVNKLLDLISVSKGWCSVLTTLPVIWTQIWLDQREPDYLAKAMMCIQLSGECELDLNIWDLTADEWRGISSMIVPEGRRIRRLSFRIYDPDYMVTRQVLGDFTKLPVLQELSLPNGPRRLSDQQYIHALLTEKMPSIKMIDMPACTMQDQIWNPYLTYCSLEAESLTKEAVETLMRLPRLEYLTFVETAQTLENIPSVLTSSFGSVLSFAYEGVDICRRLTWIGNNLLVLSTHYPENGDANALLTALSRFPQLFKLTITILSSSWGQPIQNNSHSPTPHNSIRVLYLETSIQNQYDENWEVFFSIFFPASPCLENLSVRYGLITDMGWSSIQSITNLRYLDVFMWGIDDSSSTPLDMEFLRRFRLTVHSHGLAKLAKLLARLQSTSLQTFQLTVIVIHPPTVPATPYIVAGAAFPNITSLVISNESSATWELRALSKLRDLEVQAPTERNHMMYWVSDVLEAILMRPHENPALEKVTLTCDFVEWDILILMLERRNFLNDPGISSIKTLVVNYDLPYRLLYPLSELLGGRFVERDSNQSFSLDAIGELMWNESIPGCMQCHYSFRGCDSLLEPPDGIEEIHPKEAAGRGKEYHLTTEYLVADPPLPLEMKLWLSERRERRDAWAERHKETRGHLNRKLGCDRVVQSEQCTITEDILVGAHFVHD